MVYASADVGRGNLTFMRRFVMAFMLATLTCVVGHCSAQSARVSPSTAITAIAGPLRVHPTNRRYFTDDSGKAIYLAGPHTWNGLYDARLPLDYPAYLDFLVEHNCNFTKFRAWDSTLAYGPLYYKRTGPGTAADGQLRLDLNQFDQAFFDRLRERVIAAREKRIYVLIMLFTTEEANGNPAFSDPLSPGSFDHTAKSRWEFHPYNKLNNINGIDGGTVDNSAPARTETLSHAGITALREAYIRKVIDTVNDLDNVLYEIANETHNVQYSATKVHQHPVDGNPYGPLAATELQWQSHMIEYIHEYERGKPKQHPVVATIPLFAKTDVVLASSAEAISPSGHEHQGNPPTNDGKKIVLADSDHFGWIMWRGTRSWAWKTFLRGNHPIPLDSLPTSIQGHDGGGWGGGDMPDMVAARRAMGHTRAYATKMDLASMVPSNDLSSTSFCLANPGSEYLVYQPTGGDFTVKLVAGTYAYEWFNAEKGLIAETGGIESNDGSRSFTPPFSGDAVLYLRRKAAR